MIRQQIKQALWQLLDQHYNVDHNQPYVLIAKNHYGKNQVDQIGESLGTMVEMIISQLNYDQIKQEPSSHQIAILNIQPNDDDYDMEIYPDFDYRSTTKDF
jgi:hypothetical protein